MIKEKNTVRERMILYYMSKTKIFDDCKVDDDGNYDKSMVIQRINEIERCFVPADCPKPELKRPGRKKAA